MDRGKRIIGILLILISVTALFSWEKWGKNRFFSDDVLVCRENVSKGEMIREDMLETVKMDINTEGWISPEEKDYVIGKEAAGFIHRQMPLFKEYFALSELTAGGSKGKFVMTVPQDWLVCLPVSISRGDNAYFFSGGSLVTKAPVTAVNVEYGSLDIIVTEKQAGRLSAAASAGEKLAVIYS